MKDKNLRFHADAPARVPARIQRTLFASADSRLLTVTVSAKEGVSAYGFSYDGAPVAMGQGTGTFQATVGRKALLEWVMLGAPGGSMNVAVTSGGEPVANRAKSTIIPPHSEGYDALEIRL